MSKKKSVSGKHSVNNPVAKHAHQFNRSIVFADKTRYTRKTKHKEQNPFLITSIFVVIKKGFCPQSALQDDMSLV